MTDHPAIDVAAATGDELGEAPLGEAGTDTNGAAIRWVDILRGLWHRLDLASGTIHTVKPDAPLTGFAPAADGGFVGAFAPASSGGADGRTEGGLARFEVTGRISAWLHRPETDLPRNRFNDAGTDPAGRFLAGTMNEEGDSASGSLYALDAAGVLSRLLGDLVISNTVAFSPDGDVFYTADSAKGELRAYRYDVGRGAIVERFEGFRPDPDLPGAPDGSAVDSEGYLWNARWGAGCLVRLAPDGRTDRIVTLPVPQPTSCAFVSTRLFVTSARTGLSESALADAPLSGSLFCFEAGVAGRARTAYAANAAR